MVATDSRLLIRLSWLLAGAAGIVCTATSFYASSPAAAFAGVVGILPTIGLAVFAAMLTMEAYRAGRFSESVERSGCLARWTCSPEEWRRYLYGELDEAH